MNSYMSSQIAFFFKNSVTIFKRTPEQFSIYKKIKIFSGYSWLASKKELFCIIGSASN